MTCGVNPPLIPCALTFCFRKSQLYLLLPQHHHSSLLPLTLASQPMALELPATPAVPTNNDPQIHDASTSIAKMNGESGRERLKRHREEVAREVVRVPDKWGKEQLMKDWIDFANSDALWAPHAIILAARDALIADATKSRSQRLRIHTTC